MEKPKLLIIDDNEDLRTQMRWALSEEYEVFQAGDRQAALDIVRMDRPPLVTLDLGLPPRAQSAEEGFAALDDIQAADPDAKIIVITGREEREHALRAVGEGAYDYFPKPIEVEDLKVVLRRAYKLYGIEQERRESKTAWGSTAFEEMLGASRPIQETFAAIRKVAPSDAPVLIMGESGTGKELVAGAIHRLGRRKNGSFVAINLGAIPENLLESELFGHEKGSFTGAHMQRKGRIEAADGGTLFLDEIGELPHALQVKLLRFLQEKRLTRVGGRQEIAVNTRVLAATNVDLKAAMSEGRFREDLYYRIGVVVLTVPPLRERGDDVELLAKAFLERFASEAGKKIGGYAADALKALAAYSWPGNVRELENRVRRAVVMADGRRISREDLELTADGGTDAQGLREARADVERETIRRALARNHGNMSQTAAELGISRPTLYGLVEKLGIEREKRDRDDSGV